MYTQIQQHLPTVAPPLPFVPLSLPQVAPLSFSEDVAISFPPSDSSVLSKADAIALESDTKSGEFNLVIVGDDREPAADLELAWDQVAQLINQGRRAEFYVAKLLTALQRRYRYAKDEGGFVVRLKQFAKDWGLAISTLYVRIRFYKLVMEGIDDLQMERIGKLELVKWGMSEEDWEAAAVDHADEIRQLADVESLRQERFTDEIGKQIALESKRQAAKAPSLSLKLVGLGVEERKKVPLAALAIGTALAKQSNGGIEVSPQSASAAFSRWFLEVVADEAAKHPPLVSNVVRRRKGQGTCKGGTHA